MRPVNLIPPESRRGTRAPLRAGIASYGVVAVLAIAVVALTAIVLTGNTVSEREQELAQLEARKAEVTAQAQALSPYVEFAALRQQRQLTIQSLAESRFDWERVLRELSLILPADVWLIRVSGSASPDALVEGLEDTLRAGAAGPALSLIGCGASQDAVARFAAALEDIDGVTRVGIAKAQRPTGAATPSEDDCRTKDFISRFEITAAFDEVPVPAAVVPADPAAPAPTTPVSEEDAEGSSAEGTEQQASDVIPGAVR